MVGVEVVALILKSTMFAGGWAGKHTATTPLLFAVAVPEIWICWAVVVMAGVKSTSTCAGVVQGFVLQTARVGIKQAIVDDVCTVPQLPEPLVTLAVGVDASPVVGKPTAVKVTLEAVSGPVLVMLKVNAT